MASSNSVEYSPAKTISIRKPRLPNDKLDRFDRQSALTPDAAFIDHVFAHEVAPTCVRLVDSFARSGLTVRVTLILRLRTRPPRSV